MNDCYKALKQYSELFGRGIVIGDIIINYICLVLS